LYAGSHSKPHKLRMSC